MLKKAALVSITVLLASIGAANADIVNFENVTGPMYFGNPNQTLSYTFADGVTATFTGGTVLTDTSNLPADETSVYGTIAGSNSNPLTVTFSQPVTNFFLDILNGNVVPVDYTISDNEGHSATFDIPSNLNSGLQFYSIPASGTVVTITAGSTDGFWDFFIDNVGFDQATPAVPEPNTIALFGMALLTLGGLSLRRKSV